MFRHWQRDRSMTERLTAFQSTNFTELVALDIWQHIVEIVIFARSAFAFAEKFHRLDKLDSLNPLHHFVGKLVLDPKPERRSVNLGQRRSIHLQRQDGIVLDRIGDALGVIITAAKERLAK